MPRVSSSAKQAPPTAEEMQAILEKLNKKFGVKAPAPDAAASLKIDFTDDAAEAEKEQQEKDMQKRQKAKEEAAKTKKARAEAASAKKAAASKPKPAEQPKAMSAMEASKGGSKKGAEIEFKDGVWNGQVMYFKAYGKGVYKYHTGAVWKGECKEGKHDGKGVFTTAAGTRIEGFFKANQINGPATATFVDGSVMESKWIEDKIELFEHSFSDGRTYKGQWWRDTMKGKGRLEFSSGEVWEGGFLDNKLHGKQCCKSLPNGDNIISDFKEGEPIGKSSGRVTYPPGDVYDGDLEDGLPHGQGKISFYDGQIQEGSFEKGVYTMTREYSNGDKYEGSMLLNMPNGNGKFIFADNGQCIEGVFDNGAFECNHEYDDGKRYQGRFKAGVRSGHGILVEDDGCKYEGEFEDDLFHGQGTLRLANGAVYKGGFEHGMYHGHGTLDTRELHDKADQTEKGVFEGMWEAGQRSGIGEWIADDGTKFKGMYAEDQFHGSGLLQLPDNSSYDGEWNEGQRQGNGKQVYSDGSTYEGEWVGGSICGQGKKVFFDETEYLGEWADGKRHGEGKQTVPASGHTYAGLFEDDAYHGQGTCEWSNGSKYEGDWENGLPNGNGIYTAHDGGKVEGLWKNGLVQGQCLRNYINGDNYEGDCNQGLRQGQGKMVYASGGEYEGGFFEDSFFGFGIFRYADGSKYEGMWKTGVRHGKGKFEERNGAIVEGNFFEGLPQGFAFRSMPNGSVYKGSFENGLYEGNGQAAFSDKSLYSGNWFGGLRSGTGVWLSGHESAPRPALVCVDLCHQAWSIQNKPWFDFQVPDGDNGAEGQINEDVAAEDQLNMHKLADIVTGMVDGIVRDVISRTSTPMSSQTVSDSLEMANKGMAESDAGESTEQASTTLNAQAGSSGQSPGEEASKFPASKLDSLEKLERDAMSSRVGKQKADLPNLLAAPLIGGDGALDGASGVPSSGFDKHKAGGEMVFLAGTWAMDKLSSGVCRLKQGDMKWYEGEISDGLPHGLGVHMLDDGTVFIGQWKQGRRDGYGVLVKFDKHAGIANANQCAAKETLDSSAEVLHIKESDDDECHGDQKSSANQNDESVEISKVELSNEKENEVLKGAPSECSDTTEDVKLSENSSERTVEAINVQEETPSFKAEAQVEIPDTIPEQCSVWEGEWKDDLLLQGWADCITDIGRYTGGIVQGQRYGTGLMRYKSELPGGQLVYEGQWRGDDWYGSGSAYYGDGTAWIDCEWMQQSRTDNSGHLVESATPPEPEQCPPHIDLIKRGSFSWHCQVAHGQEISRQLWTQHVRERWEAREAREAALLKEKEKAKKEEAKAKASAPSSSGRRGAASSRGRGAAARGASSSKRGTSTTNAGPGRGGARRGGRGTSTAVSRK